MKLGAFPLAAGVALLAAAAGAEPTSLAGDELRRAVSGKTVYLNVSGFELPIRYAANGRMSGKIGVAAASLSLGPRIRQWPLVDQGPPAVPALDELDGGKVLLLQAHTSGQDRAMVPQWGHVQIPSRTSCSTPHAEEQLPTPGRLPGGDK